MSRRSRIPKPTSIVSKADIRLGLMLGKVLVQFHSDDPPNKQEWTWIEELLEEKEAVATEWRFDSFLNKKYRVISHKPLPPNTKVTIDGS